MQMVNIPQDTVQLNLGNLSTMGGVFVLRRPDHSLRNAFLQLLHEAIVDTGLDIDAASSAAVLSLVAKNAAVYPWNCLVQIGIIEDDVRRFASQFQGDLFEIG